MKGKLLLVLCLLLLLSSLSYVRFSQTETKASSSSPVHNLNTGLNYTAIQDAINADETMDGQTILVNDGIYYERVVVNKSLTLIGESRDNTIVDGNGLGSAFTLNAKNISLINFTATNAGLAQPLHTVVDSQNPVAIQLNETTNCLIENMKTMDSSLVGIILYDSSQNVISGCEFFGNQSSPADKYIHRGMILFTSSASARANENTISDNVVSGNFNGIALAGYGCNDNVFARNNVSSNVNNGLDIIGFENNITSNHIWNNANGVLLDHASRTIINDNDISNSTMSGVYISLGDANNTISENTIQTNHWSIFIDWNSGNNNLFYHNNFVGNTFPVSQPLNLLNTWDDGYPSGGNYWSDYNGTDILSGTYQNVSGSDGIGDKAYSISAYNVTDRYPLMGMFSDFNATSQYHVQAVCNSTISDFQFNGTAISFNASGESGTAGFCRICIPTELINGTFTVFVNGTEVSYTLLKETNSTNSYLYFTYHHSTQEIIITPEIPSFLILPLFFITTLFSAIIYKKKKQHHVFMPQPRGNTITNHPSKTQKS